jgi:hypothetical protein
MPGRLMGAGVAVALAAGLGLAVGQEAARPRPREPARRSMGTRSPGTITRFPLEGLPGQLAVGEGAAYVALGTFPPYRLARVDERSGVVSMVTIPGQPIGVAAGEGGVWVGSCEGRIPQDACPVSSGRGLVWLAAKNRQGLYIEVRRFDPVIARFVGQPLVVPGDLHDVVHFGCTVLGAPDVPELVPQDDALWLTSTCDGEIVRIQL